MWRLNWRVQSLGTSEVYKTFLRELSQHPDKRVGWNGLVTVEITGFEIYFRIELPVLPSDKKGALVLEEETRFLP